VDAGASGEPVLIDGGGLTTKRTLLAVGAVQTCPPVVANIAQTTMKFVPALWRRPGGTLTVADVPEYAVTLRGEFGVFQYAEGLTPDVGMP
jgi:hypothetical protein